ncbi:hypothetical protein Drorol1_Dr00015212 [Drosera rotundifolia]
MSSSKELKICNTTCGRIAQDCNMRNSRPKLLNNHSISSYKSTLLEAFISNHIEHSTPLASNAFCWFLSALSTNSTFNGVGSRGILFFLFGGTSFSFSFPLSFPLCFPLSKLLYPLHG